MTDRLKTDALQSILQQDGLPTFTASYMEQVERQADAMVKIVDALMQLRVAGIWKDK